MSFRASNPDQVHPRRWWVLVAIVAVVATSIVLLSMVLPLSTGSYTIVVPTRSPSSASVQVTILFPTEVTVRFAQHNAVGISYWVKGPGVTMGDTDSASASFSFWSWGGSYVVGAYNPIYACGYPCFLPTSAQVWANVTTGLF